MTLIAHRRFNSNNGLLFTTFFQWASPKTKILTPKKFYCPSDKCANGHPKQQQPIRTTIPCKTKKKENPS